MYKYFISNHFKRQTKRYTKKFPSLKNNLIEILKNFEPTQHPHLGEKTYKIRFKLSELPRGASKSFRLIILLLEVDNLITPISIYYKGDKQTILRKEIRRHMDIIKQELYDR